MWNSGLLSGLKDRFTALSRRDRTALVICGLVLAVFFLYQFVFHPMKASSERLEASIQAREAELLELKQLVALYDRLSESGAADASRDFNLFALLESLATSSGLMNRLDYMRPGSMDLDGTRKEDWVEVKLSGVTLEELTDYLHRIRSSGKGVYIKRLSARKDGDFLDIVLQPAVARVK